MNALTVFHVAAGSLALASGAFALALRKGKRRHTWAGRTFVAAMLAMVVTASILRGSPGATIFVGYFVLTSWWAIRRPVVRADRYDAIGFAAALLLATGFIVHGFEVISNPTSRTEDQPGVQFTSAAIMLLAAGFDLRLLLRRELSALGRITRHLCRMCFAFFIATGSFFLGQQDEMPAAVRGSPVLFVLAFAPFGFLVFWLVRVRFAGAFRRIAQRSDAQSPMRRPNSPRYSTR